MKPDQARYQPPDGESRPRTCASQCTVSPPCYRCPVDNPAVRQALAALPGWLETGEPNIAARIAEYGADFEQWPCDEWDWTRHLLVPQIDGQVRDVGPAYWDWETPWSQQPFRLSRD